MLVPGLGSCVEQRRTRRQRYQICSRRWRLWPPRASSGDFFLRSPRGRIQAGRNYRRHSELIMKQTRSLTGPQKAEGGRIGHALSPGFESCNPNEHFPSGHMASWQHGEHHRLRYPLAGTIGPQHPQSEESRCSLAEAWKRCHRLPSGPNLLGRGAPFPSVQLHLAAPYHAAGSI